jgi:hypothetical protein
MTSFKRLLMTAGAALAMAVVWMMSRTEGDVLYDEMEDEDPDDDVPEDPDDD